MIVKQKFCSECGHPADHFPEALRNPPAPDAVPQPVPQHIPVSRSSPEDEPETDSEPPSHGSQLPDGWEKHQDEESGNFYYHNFLSDTVQWERPHDENFRLHPERQKEKPMLDAKEEIAEETIADDAPAIAGINSQSSADRRPPDIPPMMPPIDLRQEKWGWKGKGKSKGKGRGKGKGKDKRKSLCLK